MSTVPINEGLYLKLFGIPELYWQGEQIDAPSAKPLALLCYLGCCKEEVTRKEIAELLWKGKGSSVRVALHTLKGFPNSDDWLVMEDQLVSLNATSDFLLFSKAIVEDDYAGAIALWQQGSGQFLRTLEVKAAEPFFEWVEVERFRLQQQYLEALSEQASLLTEEEKYTEAIDCYKALLEEDSLNESAHRSIMQLYFRADNRQAAVEQFESCREVLAAELEVEPSEETLELLKLIEQGGVSQAKTALLLEKDAELAELPTKLIGRDNLLNDIKENLQQGSRLLLHGFGGVGKTALAANIATQLVSENKKVLWLQIGNDDPDSVFDALMRPFEAQQKVGQAPTEHKASVVKEVLEAQDLNVVVLDDVWNSYSLSKVLEALPESIALLVTARQRYPKLKRIDIGDLERSASRDLLSHYAEKDLSSEAFVDELCDLLGDHAFALQIAGVTLAVDLLSPKALYKQIANNPHSLKLSSDFAEQGRESVASLMNVSLEAVSDEAYEAFMAMGALFAPSSTPEYLSLITRRDVEETEAALVELQGRALLKRIAESGSDVVSYRLHDLAFSLAKVNTAIRERTVVFNSKNFIEAHQTNIDLLDTEIVNILGATESANQKYDSQLFIDLIYPLVSGANPYFVARGHTPRSRQLAETALKTAKKIDAVEQAHYIAGNLGNYYKDFTGDSEAALKAYETAVEFAKQMKNTKRVVIGMGAIAMVHFELGNQDSADAYFDEAQEIALKENEIIAIVKILQNRMWMAGQQEQPERAKNFGKEALTMLSDLENDSPEKHALGFYTRLNLAVAEKELGNSKIAMTYLNEAMQLAKANDNDIWKAFVFESLAETHHGLGDRDSALDNLEKAMALYKEHNATSQIDMLSVFIETNSYSSEVFQ